MKRDKQIFETGGNENGYVLIGVLFILLLMIIIGMAATSDTSLELQIAGNERTHKETFYQADGTIQIAIRLVEESIGSRSPFTALDADGILVDPDTPNNTILIVDNIIWNNSEGRDFTDFKDDMTIGGGRDFAYFPGGYNPGLADPDAPPHSNVIVESSQAIRIEGTGSEQMAGYDGQFEGPSKGGAKILYTIYSQYKGKNQSESIIEVRWRHVIGLQQEGRYD